MRIQVYTLNSDELTWSKDGTLGFLKGTWSLEKCESDRSRRRLIVFLSENTDKIGDNEWLLSLSEVFYVPFVRFGDEIAVEKPKKKEKKDENQRLQDEKASISDE